MHAMHLGMDPVHLLMSSPVQYKEIFKRLNSEATLEVSSSLRDIFIFTEARIKKALHPSLDMMKIELYSKRIYASIYKYIHQTTIYSSSIDEVDDLFGDSSTSVDTSINLDGDSSDDIDLTSLFGDGNSATIESSDDSSVDNLFGDSSTENTSSNDLFGGASDTSEGLDLDMEDFNMDLGLEEFSNINLTLMSEEDFYDYDTLEQPTPKHTAPFMKILQERYNNIIQNTQSEISLDAIFNSVKKWSLLTDATEDQIHNIYEFLKEVLINSELDVSEYSCYVGHIQPLTYYGEYKATTIDGSEIGLQFSPDSICYILLYQLKRYMEYEDTEGVSRIESYKEIMKQAQKSASPRKIFMGEAYFNLAHHSKKSLISAVKLHQMINKGINENYKTYASAIPNLKNKEYIKRMDITLNSLRDVSKEVYSEKTLNKVLDTLYNSIDSNKSDAKFRVTMENATVTFEKISNLHAELIAQKKETLISVWGQNNFSKYSDDFTKCKKVFLEAFKKKVINPLSPLHEWFKSSYIKLINMRTDQGKSRISLSRHDMLHSIETVLALSFMLDDFQDITLFDFIELSTIEEILGYYLTPVSVNMSRARITRCQKEEYNLLFNSQEIQDIDVTARDTELQKQINELYQKASSATSTSSAVITPYMEFIFSLPEEDDMAKPVINNEDGTCTSWIHYRQTPLFRILSKQHDKNGKSVSGMIRNLIYLYKSLYEYKLIKDVITFDNTVPLEEGLKSLSIISNNQDCSKYSSMQVNSAIQLLHRWDSLKEIVTVYQNQNAPNSRYTVLKALQEDYGIIGLNDISTRMFNHTIPSFTSYSVNREYDIPSESFTKNLIKSYRAARSTKSLISRLGRAQFGG